MLKIKCNKLTLYNTNQHQVTLVMKESTVLQYTKENKTTTLKTMLVAKEQSILNVQILNQI